MVIQYKLFNHVINVKTVATDKYRGVYLSEDNTILIKEDLENTQLLKTLIHELTHVCYEYNYKELTDVIMEYNPANKIGDYTSEALATFNGKFGEEIISEANRIYKDILRKGV